MGLASRVWTFSSEKPKVLFVSLRDTCFPCKVWVCARDAQFLVDREDAWSAGTSGAWSEAAVWGSPVGFWVCGPVSGASPCSLRPRGAPLPASQHLLTPQLLWLAAPPWCPCGPQGRISPFPLLPTGSAPRSCSFPAALPRPMMASETSRSPGQDHSLPAPWKKAFLFSFVTNLVNLNITFSKQGSFLSILPWN